MKKEVIANGIAKFGPYSTAIESGNILYMSGQLGIDATGEFVSFDAKSQAKKVMENASAILQAAGYSFDDVVKCMIFLTDLTDFAAINEIYSSYFKEPYPARSCVQVAALPKGAKVEIEMIAIH